MANGFLNGALLGAVVAVAGAGTVSVLTGPVGRGGVTPEAAAVEVPAGSGFNGARDDRAAELPGAQPGTQPTPLPTVAPPEKDDLTAMAGADVTPGAQPQAAGDQAGLVAPTSGGDAPGLSASGEGTVARVDTARVTAPEAPESEPSISTEPAQPQPPATEDSAGLGAGAGGLKRVDEPATVAGENAEQTPEEPLEPAGQDVETVANSMTEATPEPAAGEAREEVVIRIAPEGEAVTDGTAGTDTETVAASEPAAEPKPEPEPDPQPGAEAMAEPPAPVAEARPEVASGAGLGTPATTMPKPAAGVQTGRLPRVGAAAEAAGAAEQAAGTGAENGAENAPEMAVDKAALPPVQRYAEPFQGDENKPKMAIVLIDEGVGPVGVEALTTFPYPLSFAVDTSRPDAEEAMAKYRAAGFEVLAMVRLPEGATPVDVEQALPVLLAKVPEAVGVMEAPGDGIQFDRKVSDQVAQILGDQGYGLLLYSKGLNTAQKLAAKNGVPSSTIFRDFDAQGQKPGAIRRFLNHGALKAESEDGVVMVGRLTPDTVTALLLWGLEDRANQVALAPVTQLLNANR